MQGTLDTAGAANYLGWSESALEKKRCYGGGPDYIKMGRSVRYRIKDIDGWLDKQMVSSTKQKSPSYARSCGS